MIRVEAFDWNCLQHITPRFTEDEIRDALAPIETRMQVTDIVKAMGEEPIFKTGERVRISVRYPVGHYRIPCYIRGKRGSVEAVIEPAAVNNEQEGFGRNAGAKGYYYRVEIPLAELWPGYAGSLSDGLRREQLMLAVDDIDNRSHFGLVGGRSLSFGGRRDRRPSPRPWPWW